MADTPAVLLIGPRRAGKTTLAHEADQGLAYHTLDDQTTLEFAAADPIGFIRGIDRAVIDEVQRVPELLLAIKRSIDEDYRPGRFLLTGSANIRTLPRVSDSLAGRMETIRLLPLSQGEIRRTRPRFIEHLFLGQLTAPAEPVVGEQLIDLVTAGGFPEMLARPTERRRAAWARAYLESVLTRDLPDIAEVEKLSELPRFVRLLAQQSAQLVNFSAAGGGIGVTHATSRRYVSLLEKVFLVAVIEPWHSNALKRLVKTPKLHFVDTGLLTTSRGLTTGRLALNRTEFGAVLETFVYGEIAKMLTWIEPRATMYHFRDWQKNEVDIVLERDDGLIAGVEIKASATVSRRDFSGLQRLAEAAGDRFAFGAVLYDGESVVPFGGDLAAAPLSCLWS